MVRECRPPAREPARSWLARRHGPAAPRSPAARTSAPPRRVPATAPRDQPSVRGPRATHTSTTAHAFRYSHFRRFWLRPALCVTTRGLPQAPRCAIYWKWKGVGTLLSTYRPPAVYAIHRSAWKGYSRNFALTEFSEVRLPMAKATVQTSKPPS